MSFFNLFTESVILEDDELTDEEADHINPTGEKQDNETPPTDDTQNNNPSDNTQDSAKSPETDDVDLDSNEPITDEEPLGDTDSNDDYNDDSISSYIKSLQSTIDKDLDMADIKVRKDNLFNSFELALSSIDHIYKSVEFMMNHLNIRNEYDNLLSSIVNVKNIINQYMVEMFPHKSYLESKYFLSDIFVYLIELNKSIESIQNMKKK